MSRLARRSLLLFLVHACCSSAVLAKEEMHVVPVDPLMIIPFVVLLLAIAVAPFINKHWWERFYPHVALSLGLVTIIYYVFVLDNLDRMLQSGQEYISFICLIGSLFVVAGGIHIRIKGKSKPLANVFLLSVGAVLANIVGTTGASMILIRPYIRVNKYRIKPYHVVFFIIIVSNMGGALTPIGDPPLFLGYLKGIPFFWIAQTVWFKWAIAMALILGTFYLIDLLNYNKLPARSRHSAEEAKEVGEASGVQNIFFLMVILAAVFIQHPVFVREALMILAAAGSYLTTKHEIHQKNEFNFLPIKEVAFLFAGIFATMVPALDWLTLNASQLGIQTAGQFYWTTGLLSAFLDNAPTYLNFLSAAIGLHVQPNAVTEIMHVVRDHGADIARIEGPQALEIKNAFATLLKYHYDHVAAGSIPADYINTAYLIGNESKYVQAISLAAVFFGSCTYIGNGPNFMVKSIAEQSGVPCPSFFGYIVRYTLPILLPIFFGIWLLFFFI